MEKKYRLLENDTITVGGKTLYRIEALKDFASVKKGNKGSYLEKEENLSHEGKCWVFGNALVFGNAKVFGDAWVYDYTLVCDHARVYGNACVYGNALLYGKAEIRKGKFTCGVIYK